jgi:hypothetical protein
MSRVVAGTLLLPNGQPMANASIYFTAKRTEPVSIIEGANTFFLTNNAGVYNQSVVNGYYAVSIEYIADASGAYTRRWQVGDVFIEDGPTTTLEALIIASTVPDDIALGVFYEILGEAQQAAEDAQNAAAAAQSSAETAADAAASISIGTGPTQISNNEMLGDRLGTTGNLGTMAQQNSNAVAITGGSVADAVLPIVQTGKTFSSTTTVTTASNTALILNSNSTTAEIQHRISSAAAGYTKWAATYLSMVSPDGLKSSGVDNTSAFCDGMRFGNVANSNSNVMDWYEEGFFTVIAVGATTPGSPVYTIQRGNYQRAGNTVFIQMQVAYPSHNGAGALQILGIPYPSSSTKGATAFSLDLQGLSHTSGSLISCRLGQGSAVMSLREKNPLGAVSNINVQNAGTELVVTGLYEV